MQLASKRWWALDVCGRRGGGACSQLMPRYVGQTKRRSLHERLGPLSHHFSALSWARSCSTGSLGRRKASKQVSLLRNAAYVDYLCAVARLARSSTYEERRAVLVEAADAKARIAI